MRMCLAKPGYDSGLLLPVYYRPNKCSIKFYFCSTFIKVYICSSFLLLKGKWQQKFLSSYLKETPKQCIEVNYRILISALFGEIF